MSDTYYAIVQTYDNITTLIGPGQRFYSSLEEAKKVYMDVCEYSYKNSALEIDTSGGKKHWFTNVPRLIKVDATVLSPKQEDPLTEFTNSELYRSYREAAIKIKKQEELNKKILREKEGLIKEAAQQLFGV